MLAETLLIMYRCLSDGILKNTKLHHKHDPLSPLLTERFVLNEERFLSLHNGSHTTKEKH